MVGEKSTNYVLLLQGKNFIRHAYVPEWDEEAGVFFYDQGDHNHIYKRIGFHTRQGGPADLNVEVFDEVKYQSLYSSYGIWGNSDFVCSLSPV